MFVLSGRRGARTTTSALPSADMANRIVLALLASDGRERCCSTRSFNGNETGASSCWDETREGAGVDDDVWSGGGLGAGEETSTAWRLKILLLRDTGEVACGDGMVLERVAGVASCKFEEEARYDESKELSALESPMLVFETLLDRRAGSDFWRRHCWRLFWNQICTAFSVMPTRAAMRSRCCLAGRESVRNSSSKTESSLGEVRRRLRRAS